MCTPCSNTHPLKHTHTPFTLMHSPLGSNHFPLEDLSAQTQAGLSAGLGAWGAGLTLGQMTLARPFGFCRAVSTGILQKVWAKWISRTLLPTTNSELTKAAGFEVISVPLLQRGDEAWGDIPQSSFLRWRLFVNQRTVTPGQFYH